jgi:hypothetical protein
MTITANPVTAAGDARRLSQTPSQKPLDDLLAGNPALWRGCDMAGRGDHGQPTGYPGLDAILPGRGWPRNALVEVVSPRWGMGELQLLVPLMRNVVERGQWILCIAPPYQLYAPALAQAGIHTRQVLVVRPEASLKDALWSMEKALQTDNCGLVLAWQNWLPNKVLRRLQLAAETGQTLGVLLQRHVSKDSPSALRLQIKACSSRWPADAESGGVTVRDADVTVLRARGSFRPLSTRVSLPA